MDVGSIRDCYCDAGGGARLDLPGRRVSGAVRSDGAPRNELKNSEGKRETLEQRGIDPRTSRMLSERSTT